MKILVCVKQVPDSESALEINGRHDWIDTGGLVFRMNRIDEYAVEEALRIRETFPSVAVDAITVGPSRCASTVRRAMEMGADRGIHILQHEERYRPPMETASLLRSYAGKENYDLILTGVMAEDDMHAQTGPLLSAMLGFPCITSLMRLELSSDASRVTVEREIEGGSRELFEIKLPALLTVQSGINRPRYPSLSNVLKARSREITTLGEEIVASSSHMEKVHRLYYPERAKQGVMLRGGGREKAHELLAILRERSFL